VARANPWGFYEPSNGGWVGGLGINSKRSPLPFCIGGASGFPKGRSSLSLIVLSDTPAVGGRLTSVLRHRRKNRSEHVIWGGAEALYTGIRTSRRFGERGGPGSRELRDPFPHAGKRPRFPHHIVKLPKATVGALNGFRWRDGGFISRGGPLLEYNDGRRAMGSLIQRERIHETTDSIPLVRVVGPGVNVSEKYRFPAIGVCPKW